MNRAEKLLAEIAKIDKEKDELRQIRGKYQEKLTFNLAKDRSPERCYLKFEKDGLYSFYPVQKFSHGFDSIEMQECWINAQKLLQWLQDNLTEINKKES